MQISQEAGQVVWYSQLFQNFPQLTVIHTVKGFAWCKKERNWIFFVKKKKEKEKKREIIERFYVEELEKVMATRSSVLA